ncbi:MAG: hypothetical protein ACI8T1_004728 [Verrucomicrobiales bacterium]|jgi:hypothetical protein
MQAFAKASHTPVQIGASSNKARTRHERDRQAKSGTSRPPETRRKKAGKTNKISEKNLVPASEMKLIRFSSENRGNDRKAAYAIDGKSNNVWHSQFSDKVAEHPHELVIDLGNSRTLSGFRYLARQDRCWNGAFADTKFYVSNKADAFPDTPAAKTTFKKLKTSQKANCEQPTPGRYVTFSFAISQK